MPDREAAVAVIKTLKKDNKVGNASRFKKTCPLSEQEPSDSLGHPCPMHETNFKKPMNTLLPFILRPVNQAIRRAVDGLNQGFGKASSGRAARRTKTVSRSR